MPAMQPREGFTKEPSPRLGSLLSKAGSHLLRRLHDPPKQWVSNVAAHYNHRGVSTLCSLGSTPRKLLTEGLLWRAAPERWVFRSNLGNMFKQILVHSSIMPSSQQVETTRLPINGYMDEPKVVHPHTGIAFHHKKE